MNPTAALEEPVRSFLRDHLDSFEQLEALLLLGRQPDRVWSRDEIAGALHIESDAAAAALDHLVREELIARVPQGPAGAGTSFRYHPGTPALSQAAASLAVIWEQSRVEIMNLMSTNAMNRIRHQMARVFADAFVLGRKKDG